jgi:uncharacterized protein (TIGR03435 family)
MAVMRPWIAAMVIGIAATALIAQETAKLAFDAASVKPTKLPEGVGLVDGILVNAGRYSEAGGPGSEDPGRIHYPVVSLTRLLKRAYQGYFEIKAPDWADSDLVAVDAAMPPTTTKEQFQKMLENLLENRFALKTHVETKGITGYILTVAKNGPKFKASPPDNESPDPNYQDHRGADGWPATPPHMHGMIREFAPGERFRLVGPQATMTDLVKHLGDLLDSVVEDRTALKAAYDITLTFAGQFGGRRGATALLQPLPPSADSSPEPPPNIFSALQSQLGLRLEKQKMFVDVLVVDHLEKTPTSN